MRTRVDKSINTQVNRHHSNTHVNRHNSHKHARQALLIAQQPTKLHVMQCGSWPCFFLG